jgi:MOSC domain-containing protein YiiM
MIALCADVEVAELKGAVAVFEEAVLEGSRGRQSCGQVAVSMELHAHKGRQDDDGDASRQSSWEEATPKSMQSRLS